VTNKKQRVKYDDINSTPYLKTVVPGNNTIGKDGEAEEVDIQSVHLPEKSLPDIQMDYPIENQTLGSTKSSKKRKFEDTFDIEQFDPQNVDIIAFTSRSLKPHEKNYSITKLECSAIVFALEKLRPFLYGRNFTVEVDHQALESLLSTENDLLNNKLLSFRETLCEHSFDIKYIGGQNLPLADALSRIHDNTAIPVNFTQKQKQIILSCKKEGYNVIPRSRKTARKYIKLAHGFSHAGTNGMIDYIHEKLKVHWKGIHKDVSKFIQSCTECIIYNYQEEGFMPPTSQLFTFPFDRIAIDVAHPGYTTKEGNNYILIVIDYTTRFVILRPLRTEKASELAETLLDIFNLLGFPKFILKDGGPANRSELIKNLTEIMKIKTRDSIPYLPQSNPIVERKIRELMNMLKKNITEDVREEWDSYLSFVQFHINHRLNKMNKTFPFVSFFGRNSTNWLDLNIETNYNELSEDELHKIEMEFREHMNILSKYVYPNIAKLALKNQEIKNKKFKESHKIFMNGGRFLLVN
jgi:hypothetical protein